MQPTTWFGFNVGQICYMGRIQKKNLGVSQKDLKNWREFDAWNSPALKSTKILMLVVITVCRNKFYKCHIFVKILYLRKLNKFLLVINPAGNVFF